MSHDVSFFLFTDNSAVHLQETILASVLFYCRRHFSYTDLKHIKRKINSICIYLSSLEPVPVDITFFLKHFFLVKSLKKRE